MRRLSAMALMLCIIGTRPVTAQTKVVPTDYATIQAAITAATAGDTILVLTGTYTGPVIVDKSLVLLGAGVDSSIIEAPADFGTNMAYDHSLTGFVAERAIVYIGNSSPVTVTLSGFTIDGARRGPDITQYVGYSGILAERCTVTITQNKIVNVLPADSAGSTWEETKRYNGRGIHVRGNGSAATIAQNTLADINRYYILVNAADDTSMVPAVFPTALVANNTIVGKGVYNAGQKGIWFNSGAWGTISDNTITNLDYISSAIEPERASGIIIRFGYLNPANRNLILRNTVSSSTAINNKGLYVQGIRDSVADNTITGYRWNIEVHDGDSTVIVRNAINGGLVGVLFSAENPATLTSFMTVGGSPGNGNIFRGQNLASPMGSVIALGYRNPLGDSYHSSVPIDARHNDFGVYTDSAVQAAIWDRSDSTIIWNGNPLDSVIFKPYVEPKMRLAVKAYLQGPYASGAMSMGLRTSGALAAHFGSVPIPATAVDSIQIEVRNAATAAGSTVRKYAAAWLLSDGSIRAFGDTTLSGVEFDTTGANYYIVLRHRNHLSVMSAAAQALNYVQTSYDFTTAVTQAYGSGSMKGLGAGETAPFGLYAGDVTGNGQLRYSGAGNDRGPILARLSGSFLGILSGYYAEDVNLNGQVRYSGAANDRGVILANLGGAFLGIRSANVP